MGVATWRNAHSVNIVSEILVRKYMYSTNCVCEWKAEEILVEHQLLSVDKVFQFNCYNCFTLQYFSEQYNETSDI